MNLLGLVVIVLAAYLAFKVAGALLKILMFGLVLVGVYWFAAPYFGLPSVSDLFYVFGPDFEGRRIEEVMRPSSIADDVSGRVVDRVLERATERVELPLPAQAPSPQPLPEPLPEPAGADAAAPSP